MGWTDKEISKESSRRKSIGQAKRECRYSTCLCGEWHTRGTGERQTSRNLG